MTSEGDTGWDEDGSQCTSRRESMLASLDYWDYTIELECLKGTEDLHLAAELGKTLLERNKELENDLKLRQLTIDEQSKEIEHLTKQTEALRRTNDNRIRLYERLEVDIQEIQTANTKLAVDNATTRKELKALQAYKDTLEARCDELQAALDDAKQQQRVQRQQMRYATAKEGGKSPESAESSESQSCDQLSSLCQELKQQRARDQRRISDLESEVAHRAQEIAMLEEDIIVLRQKEEHAQSLQEEIAALEEARMNNLCGRCFKDTYGKLPNEVDMSDREDGYSDFTASDLGEKNPYREIVEKYEALMEEHERVPRMTKTATTNCLSLQDELKLSGDFTTFHKEPEVEAKRGKATPTDFSEAETSSSGFSDETSCKATQTEPNPGSFLCSIEDGEDCRFLIFDDATPIDARFRKTPAYRTLFREIFEVLKRAATAKDDGERLPLLDDLHESPKAPHATPMREDPPIDFEDLISIPDSIATSEASSLPDYQDALLRGDDATEECAEQSAKGTKDLLEFVRNAPNKQKKARKRAGHNSATRRKPLDLGESATPSPLASPSRSARRRPRRSQESPGHGGGRVMTTLQRPQGSGDKEWEYQAFVSTAAQDVAKLKKLEKSYAEVLRHTPNRQRYQQPHSSTYSAKKH